MSPLHGEFGMNVDPLAASSYRLNQRLNGQLEGVENRIQVIKDCLRNPGPEMNDELRTQLLLEQKGLLENRDRLIALLDRNERKEKN